MPPKKKEAKCNWIGTLPVGEWHIAIERGLIFIIAKGYKPRIIRGGKLEIWERPKENKDDNARRT